MLSPGDLTSTRSTRRLLALAVAFAVVASCSADDDSSEVRDVSAATSVTISTATAPSTSAPSTSTPSASTPPSSTPVTTGPVTSAPVTSAPVTSAPTPADPADPLLVSTGAGPVRGAASAVAGVRNFLAIPYAEPPVEELAWRPPVERAPWSGELDGTAAGASCPQSTEGVVTAFIITPDPDPDCLTLSVWTPDDADGLPVMVWFHGGGLSTGSAHEPYYIGDDLASEGVVVVNVNYRLGAFGFLALPELRDESDDGAVGNYGFLDQQLALRWVQDNITGFGGDPDRVTIFGESAGGFSVCAHLAAPGSEGLFAQAIVQSGGGCDRLQPLEDGFDDGEELLAGLACDDVACLRARPLDQVILAADVLDGISSLVLDGVTLDRTAADRADELDDVPILIGANADEATLFTLGLEEPSDDELLEYASAVTDEPARLVALYPADMFATNLERYQAMSTDATFVCPALEFAGRVNDGYAYHFTFVPEPNPLGLGATHGAELAFLFAHPEGVLLPTEFTDRSRAMSAAMQTAWITFAATGDPGDAFDPYPATGTITVIDDPIESTDEIRDDRCDEVNVLLR